MNQADQIYAAIERVARRQPTLTIIDLREELDDKIDGRAFKYPLLRAVQNKILRMDQLKGATDPRNRRKVALYGSLVYNSAMPESGMPDDWKPGAVRVDGDGSMDRVDQMLQGLAEPARQTLRELETEVDRLREERKKVTQTIDEEILSVGAQIKRVRKTLKIIDPSLDFTPNHLKKKKGRYIPKPDKLKAARDFIGDHPGCTMDDLQKGLGMSKSAARACVAELRDREIVRKARTTKNNTSHWDLMKGGDLAEIT